MAYLFGDTAAVTLPTAVKMKSRSFQFRVFQSIMRALALGDTYTTKRGSIKDWSFTTSGFVDSTGIGISAIDAAGSTVTGTFDTGTTLTGTLIVGEITAGADRESASTQSMSGEGSGALTETFA